MFEYAGICQGKNNMVTQQLEESNITPVTSEHPLRRFVYSFLLHLNNFLLENWATLLTTLLGLVVLVALSIPFLSYFGVDAIAKPLFFSLHYVCAQIPSHSFYIFGHQLRLCAEQETPAWHPLVALDTDDPTYGARWPDTDVRSAREHVGTPPDHRH